MSGADDQRAEIVRLGDHVVVPGKVTGCNSEDEYEVTYASGLSGWYYRTDLLPGDESDRLRAELAETRAELDRMRDVARTEDAAKRDAMVTADVWKMRALHPTAGGSSPASTDDTGCQPPHGPDERCLDCATDDEVLDAVPPWPGTPASTDGDT